MTAVLVLADGGHLPLDVDRWRSAPDPAEAALLAALADPVLDVGCGPGRVASALAGEGRVGLGIDPSPAAVAEARRRGAAVLRRSVFDHLPGEGRWATVLLLDGNIGIGGAPDILLRRTTELLAPGGTVVAELGAPGFGSGRHVARIEDGDAVGPWFPWATVDVDAWPALAAEAGLRPAEVVVRDGRWFAWADRP